MLAVLRQGDGERLWSGDYSYKAGWELSGWVVNAPEEAARLVAKRLKGQYLKDTHRPAEALRRTVRVRRRGADLHSSPA